MNEKIYIGFSKAKGFKPVSWLICFFLKKPYSHVYLKTFNNYIENFEIFQASKGMVNNLLEEQFKKDNTIIKEIELEIESENKKQMIKWAKEQLGKPYSIKSLLIITINQFLKTNFSSKDGTRRFICSAFVYKLIKYGAKFTNVPKFKKEDYITPEDIDNITTKLLEK